MASLASIPSVDRLLGHNAAKDLIKIFGRSAVTHAIREELEKVRSVIDTTETADLEEVVVLDRVHRLLLSDSQPALRPVFNLTGTVLHTNLGRAILPEEAIEAVAEAAREPSNLEYDLTRG